MSHDRAEPGKGRTLSTNTPLPAGWEKVPPLQLYLATNFGAKTTIDVSFQSKLLNVYQFEGHYYWEDRCACKLIPRTNNKGRSRQGKAVSSSEPISRHVEPLNLGQKNKGLNGESMRVPEVPDGFQYIKVPKDFEIITETDDVIVMSRKKKEEKPSVESKAKPARPKIKKKKIEKIPPYVPSAPRKPKEPEPCTTLHTIDRRLEAAQEKKRNTKTRPKTPYLKQYRPDFVGPKRPRGRPKQV